MKQDSAPPTFNKTTIAIIWVALLVATTLIFNHVLEDINNPNQQLTVSINEQGQKEVVLERNRYGHYVATGKINGQSVVFLLDTGATLVAIPEHIARQLNLKKGRAFQTQTANGTSQSYTTIIESLALGDIVMTNVPASISSGMEFDKILLGMSFLKHLQLTQQGKILKISLPD
ncbi:MAG: TIGR02281 family clan AA aspartic protease [Gammaproteobacteria bacterium]|nr:TIGR02281 family clan AA aspartic protease [Gammaproteobacteria bacterium]